MRKGIYIFYREEKPVAELHLDLSDGGSVSDWTWHGDPAVKKAMKGLPNNSYSLDASWHCDILIASRKAGLTFTTHGEGDPPIPLD